MSDKNTRLFEEFPPISYDEWKQKTIADLKGADFDKSLVWKTIEGFDVQPLYAKEDLEKLAYLKVLPGQFPFTRGKKKKDNEWHIRQNVVVENAAEANKKILDILMKGVTSVGFVIADASSWSQTEVKALLKDICLDAVELCFEVKKGKAHFLQLFVDYVKTTTYQPKNIKGSINIGYLNEFTLKGAFCENDKGKGVDYLLNAINISKEFSHFKICAIHPDYFQNAGASCSEELAVALALGAQYLSDSTDKGADAGTIARKIKFNFAVSSNYFMEIAKFRAAKMLWAQLVAAYKPVCNDAQCCCKKGCDCNSDKEICSCACKMKIHATTSTWNMTIYDPYVNMLRTQTEAMSATIGGVDSLTVLPFNAGYEKSTDFSDRIARNQQSLLKEECHFDKIVDPAAGSYYIESLTDMIAEKAWGLFLKIEEKGGFVDAYKAGFIQGIIAETAKKKDSFIATRRENLLGVNQFPNFNEVKEEKLDISVFQSQSLKSANAIAEPIKIYRGAQAFELLRYKTDQYAKTNGRPKAFMFTIGNLAFRKARAQFSTNFFACAGIEVKDNNGFETVAEGVAAAKAYGGKIVVVCSSDEEYATLAPEIFEQLKGYIVVIAGAPACADELKAKGITNFINVKSNVLETLQYYQKELGIN